MKHAAKALTALVLVLVMVFGLSACSSIALLKKAKVSDAYQNFIKTMQSELPVSVAFEQYLKADGFDEGALIIDTDQRRIRELVTALAQVETTGQVENASNFAIRHYTFTDKNGDKFTFEFYGEYLKIEDTFYQTDNSLPFISIRVEEKKSGSLLVALDEAHEGRGDDTGTMYISCRELSEEGGELSVVSRADYELSADAAIIAPTSYDAPEKSTSRNAADFFGDFEAVKGQDNASYIFKAEIERGVITALCYQYDLSAAHPLDFSVDDM